MTPDDLIARAHTLTESERLELRRAYVGAWTLDREAAFKAAHGAARTSGRLGDWYAATRALPYPLAAAAGVAACALLVRDLIPAEHFDALYGHWAQVVDA